VQVRRRWLEEEPGGGTVPMAWADFSSIPEQLRYLRSMIDVYRGTQWARRLALEIVRGAGCEARNHACMALAIGEWVQQRIAYVREFPERFQTPPRTVKDGAGDCDDHTTLIGSLAESLGIPVEVVGMKVDGKWKHVFARAQIEGKGRTRLPMPLDSTLRNTPIRQLANPITRALDRGMKVETLTV
jgi:hypothetical protein